MAYVLDSSALVELCRRGIMDSALELDFDFVIPDFLYKNPHLSWAMFNKENLISKGLEVAEVGASIVAKAMAYNKHKRSLSFSDCCALALAESRRASLLSENSALVALSPKKQVLRVGVGWLLGELMRARLITTDDLQAITSSMLADRRCPCVPAQVREWVSDFSALAR